MTIASDIREHSGAGVPRERSRQRAEAFEPFPQPAGVSAPRPLLLLTPVADPLAAGAWSVAGGRFLLDLANWDLRGLYSDAG